MEWVTSIMILSSLTSLIISMVNLVEMFVKLKNHRRKMEILDKNIQMTFDSNKDILDKVKIDFEDKEINRELAEDIIDEYTIKLSNALTEFYPKNTFDISIRKLNKSKDTLYCLNENNLVQKNTSYKVDENTESNAILNEHYRYFFVSDIDKFDKFIMPYKNSDKNWSSLYKSAIAIPIAKKRNFTYDIIGLMCVTSPQSLNNTKKNNKIIDLLKSVSDALYEILWQLSY